MEPPAQAQNEDRIAAEGIGAAEPATGQSTDRLTVYERRRKKKQQDAQARGFERMGRY